MIAPAARQPRKFTRGQDDKSGKVTATIHKLVRYNMALTEAIFELLADKESRTGVEAKERAQKLMAETQLQFRWLQEAAPSRASDTFSFPSHCGNRGFAPYR